MKRKGVALATAVGSIVLAAIAPLQVNAGQSINGYRLKQKMIYYGQMTINATSKGTRIDAKELQAFVMPNSTARVYNTTNMKYCELPQQIWIDKVSVEGHISTIKKVNTGTYAGYKINQYTADMFNEKNRWWYQIEFSTTNDIKLPKQIIDDYLTLVGLPKGYGMPLSIVRHFDKNYQSKDHRKDVFLVTYEAKPAAIDASLLSPPAGYTKVKDEMDVILGDSELNLK